MEPVGLAVGIVGLAGLFSLCLDVIEKVETYKDFGTDSQSLIAQFEADKLRFKRWGEKVGFKNQKLSDDSHKDLDDSETMASIRKILSSIQELGSSADGTQATLQTALKPDQKYSLGSVLPSEGRLKHRREPTPTSRRNKLAWTFRRRAKFVNQVQQFGALVQTLYNLVQPDGMKVVAQTYNVPIGHVLGSLNRMSFSSH